MSCLFRTYAATLLLLLGAGLAYARPALPPPPDSLRGQLRAARTAAARADVLLRIGQAFYQPFDSASVVGYALAAEQAARQAADPALEGAAVDLRGSYYKDAGSLQLATPLLRRAEKLLRTAPLHQRVNNLRNLGDLYVDLNQPNQGLRYFRQAYKLAGSLPQPDQLDQQARLLNSIGAFFYRRDQLDSTIVYSFRALRLKEQLHDSLGEAAVLGNLSVVLLKQQRYPDAARYARRAYALERAVGDSVAFSQTMGYLVKIAAARDSLPAALRLCRQQYQLYQRLKMDAALPSVEITLAGLFARLQQHDSVSFYYQRAATEARRVGAGAQVGEAISNLASYYLTRGRLAEARRWAAQGMALDSPYVYPPNTLLLLGVQHQVAAQSGDYTQAYRYLQQLREAEQQQQARNNERLTENLRVRYETDRAEQQVQLLQASQRDLRQQSELQSLRRQREVSILVGLLLLAGVIIWQVRRRRVALARQYAALEQANAALAQTTQALQAVTRSKDRLYAIVGHDLRGPLTTFDGLVQLLNRFIERGRVSELPPLVEQARQAVARLTDLLNNLLGWAASHSGELAFRPALLPVDELLAEVETLYAPTAEAAGVALRATAAPGLLVRADRQMLRTVLRNLLGNALRATPAGGTVALSAEAAPAGRLTLRVADTGPGLPPALLARLQAPEAPDAAPGPDEPAPHGTGLGLRVCRLFAERHGGRLLAANQPGGGAVLAVELPADGHPAAQPG